MLGKENDDQMKKFAKNPPKKRRRRGRGRKARFIDTIFIIFVLNNKKTQLLYSI